MREVCSCRSCVLPVGEYVLKVNDLIVEDSQLNRRRIPSVIISFSVSDEAAHLARAAFDLDLNGTTDVRDYYLFSSWIHSRNTGILDLNRDGQWDERDIDQWIEESHLFPPGDVNFDGVFDQQDLNWLGQKELDSSASRRSGDFDGDGFYTTADLTLAMQGGLQESEDDA